MSFEAHGVHFFKIILESTLQRGTVKVPTSFVRRHWQGMSNPVVLSLPNGTKSKVYWQNRDGGVWFSNGWKEFAEYAQLDVSYLTVFRYEGNSCFNVIIFETSAVEIEYPLIRDTTNEEVEEIDEEKVEKIDEASDFSGKFTEVQSKRPKEELQDNEEEEEDEHDKHCKKKTCSDYSKHRNSGSSSSQVDFKKKLKIFHDKVKEMFKSKHKHFTCIIQKTYTERDLLIMPAEFSKPYLHKEGNAILFVEPGRTWKVETKINYHGQLTFASGWRKFLSDHKLKVGDVCAFELLDSEEFVFKVTIYPLEEDSSTPLFKGPKGLSNVPSSSLKTPVTHKAKTPKSRDELYICIKSEEPTIHIEDAKRYVGESGRNVTLRVGNRSWQVKLMLYGQNSFARFSSGWFEFVRDCNLKEGDVCILKMVDKENLVITVSCLKGTKSSTPRVTIDS